MNCKITLKKETTKVYSTREQPLNQNGEKKVNCLKIPNK